MYLIRTSLQLAFWSTLFSHVIVILSAPISSSPLGPLPDSQRTTPSLSPMLSFQPKTTTRALRGGKFEYKSEAAALLDVDENPTTPHLLRYLWRQIHDEAKSPSEPPRHSQKWEFGSLSFRIEVEWAEDPYDMLVDWEAVEGLANQMLYFIERGELLLFRGWMLNQAKTYRVELNTMPATQLIPTS